MAAIDECLAPLFRIGLLTLSLIASSSVPAADEVAMADPTERDFLSDMPVVLSVSRLAQPLPEAPGAITVIDREMIRASGFHELPDVLRLVPGFLVGHLTGGITTVNYHALAEDNSRRMQVLVDGRSVYTPSFGGVDWANLPIALEDVDRIEVIRGPNGATFGANAFLATINIITRHPSQDEGAAMAFSAGQEDLRVGYVRFGKTIGNLDFRVSARYQEDAGLGSLPDDKDIALINSRLSYRLGNRDALDFQFGVNHSNAEFGSTTNPTNAVRPIRAKGAFAQLKWRHELSDESELSLQFYHTQRDVKDEFQFIVPLAARPIIGLSELTLGLNYEEQRDNIEFQHSTRLRDDLRIVWGAEGRRDAVHSMRLYGTDKDLTSTLARLFGNAEWRITPKWLANVGLMTERSSITGTAFSPRLAINYLFTPDHTLRASASSGKRTPLVTEEKADYYFRTPIFFDQVWRAKGDLRAETIHSVEFGYLGRLWDGRVVWDSRVYRDQLRDLITIFRDPTKENIIPRQQGWLTWENAEDVLVTGLETQVQARLRTATRIVLNHAYTRIKASNVRSSLDLAETGPRHSASALLIQSLPKNFDVSLGIYYLGPMRWAGSGDLIPSYTRFDLRVAHRFKFGAANAEIAAGVQNLTGDYVDFNDVNILSRRAYLSVAAEF